jgi:CheY-like chemotaxis protein
VGIGADELGTLGQAFVQAAAGRQTGDGTGLGLALSGGFVRLMGGSLQLVSQPGRGTTAHADIPFPLPTADVPQSEPAVTRRVMGLAPGSPPQRVLVVDDIAPSRQLIRRLMEPLGFAVREASNGAEAVQAWQDWSPQLILLDMRMPVMDGREATRRIKSTPHGLRTVIIALTASSFEEQREQFLALGCDDFVRKPFDEDHLLETIGRHLGLSYRFEGPSVEDLEHPADEDDAACIIGLPDGLRAPLLSALAALDVAAVERAVESVRAHDAAAAEQLARLAHRFQYERMASLLDGR